MRKLIWLLALAAASGASNQCFSQSEVLPTYARQRAAAFAFRAESSPYSPYHGGYFFPAYPAPPVVTGSWYARPYPHHFDYYRWRYNSPPPADCPCAVEGPVLAE